VTYPVITYLRADCPNCGQQWAILPDPVRGEDYYSHAATPRTMAFTVSGPGSVCPECNMDLRPHAAVITAAGEWLEVADVAVAMLN
jgi:hypothetical protein